MTVRTSIFNERNEFANNSKADDDIIDHSVSMANVEHVDDDVSSEDDGSLDDIGAENNVCIDSACSQMI